MNKHFIRIGVALLGMLFLSTACCHKADEEAMIEAISEKVWFTTLEERWNTNYYNDSIPDSYRSWSYYMIPGSENWLWYFLKDNSGYEIHTLDYDTIYYHFEYSYTYKNNCLYIKFETEDGGTEEYSATINYIDDQHFGWQHEYRPHQFERISTVNVTGGSKRNSVFKPNPKNVELKPVGPMIPLSK